MSLPPALSLYRAMTGALAPAAAWWVHARAGRGKEDRARLHERFGRGEAQRPSGVLIWLHAASVGEMGVALQLRAALAREGRSFLVTTGTRASADLFAQRGPAGARHRYAPIDTPGAARRFLKQWKPDLGVFIESELWPNLLVEAHRQGVKLALVNAILSPGAAARWKGLPRSARALLDAFGLILAADKATAETLTRLAGKTIALPGNLKRAAAPPPAHAAALGALRAAIGARPVWLAASTHEGEDEILIEAHRRLRETHADSLLIIAPRHRERGAAVAALAGGAPRRSLDQPIADAAVYVADTMGELGLFYALAPVSLVAGSLLARYEGHNPIEPAKIGSAILSGPHVQSFEDAFADLGAAGGAVIVADAAAIAAAVDRLWRDSEARAAQIAAARAVCEGGEAALDDTVRGLEALLGGAHA